MPQDQAYLEAEKKIEEAIREGATEISLIQIGLTDLPELLIEAKQLQSLDLSANNLEALPDWIGNLTNLKQLIIFNNKLLRLPESIGRLVKLKSLYLSSNQLATIPESIGQLTQLQHLNLSNNQLTVLPDSLIELKQLQQLDVSYNRLQILPEPIGELISLQLLSVRYNKLRNLPETLGGLTQLKLLGISGNQLTEIPPSLVYIEHFDEAIYFANNFQTKPEQRTLSSNPFSPEFIAACAEGLEIFKAYLRSKAKMEQTTRDEAKLILIGEGEVGKTCLVDALLDKEWQEHPTTHGIEIQQIPVTDWESKRIITLNSWDFGGQRVYRPTHQLFFSAPAVYLVVWKPREGSQQGFVKEWIQLVKRREPSAKILVVATHGGPPQRQPDIDRQELWDLFGKDTVVDYFFIDSKPDENGKRKGITDLRSAIARLAASLPGIRRSVSKNFADVSAILQANDVPYLPLDKVLAICRAHQMDDKIARLFITISHRLGHLTHYENDPALRDIVILRPDWLATAMSYVLDDEATRTAHGLVKFSRLSQLWNDPSRPADTRYDESLHRIFLRLMERFDLSYRVAGLSKDEDSDPVSLIAQLVPDTTPAEDVFTNAWHPNPAQGDIQQTQICRIVDAQNGQSANAEGLFYQLIVRLHRYSLGRVHYNDSVHWQRGLILDADYNGRALLRHIGNDVHITVRAAFPERFLGMLTEEVKYLVESFWEGLRCDVTVPCLNPNPCAGLFEVEKLIENKKRGRPEQPCSVCNQWQSIDELLSNAPAATQPISIEILEKQFASIQDKLDVVDTNTQRIMSQIDKTYTDLLKVLLDEAKEGPRLFSLIPVKRSGFNPKEWASEKFKLILWCEHIRLPLPVINGKDSTKGIYEIELTRDWFKKSAPLLKLMTSTLLT